MVTGNRGCYRSEFDKVSPAHQTEGGNLAYKLYANPLATRNPLLFLKFAPLKLKSLVKSVNPPGQKGMSGRQLDRIFPPKDRKFSSFIVCTTLRINRFTR
jgi:hypothetical protein